MLRKFRALFFLVPATVAFAQQPAPAPEKPKPPPQRHFIPDDLGYEIILWDVDPLDWKEPGPSIVSSRIRKETRPGSIVLSHDIHAQTIQAMPATLSELEAKGFKFVTVSELLKLRTPVPPPTPKPVNAPAATPSPVVAPSPNG